MPTPPPTVSLPETPDPLDPIVAIADNLTINRAITTAPSHITPADWPILIEAIRRDRARFNLAEQKRDEKGQDIIGDPTNVE